MSQLIDWEYYGSHFPNVIPKKQFQAVENQAETEFYRVIPKYKIDEIPEDTKKDCIFQLCNMIYNFGSGSAGTGVASVSNNGYSESYVVQTKEQMQNEIRELIYSTCKIRLAGAF